MMIEEAMRSYYAAYNSGDTERLRTLLDGDVVLCSAAGTQQGIDAYFATYRVMTTLFIDRMEPAHILVDEDRATVTIVDYLTARSDVENFMGRSVPQGETIRLDLTGRYHFAGGKIVRIEIEPGTTDA